MPSVVKGLQEELCAWSEAGRQRRGHTGPPGLWKNLGLWGAQAKLGTITVSWTADGLDLIYHLKGLSWLLKFPFFFWYSVKTSVKGVVLCPLIIMFPLHTNSHKLNVYGTQNDRGKKKKWNLSV